MRPLSGRCFARLSRNCRWTSTHCCRYRCIGVAMDFAASTRPLNSAGHCAKRRVSPSCAESAAGDTRRINPALVRANAVGISAMPLKYAERSSGVTYLSSTTSLQRERQSGSLPTRCWNTAYAKSACWPWPEHSRQRDNQGVDWNQSVRCLLLRMMMRCPSPDIVKRLGDMDCGTVYSVIMVRVAGSITQASGIPGGARLSCS